MLVRRNGERSGRVVTAERRPITRQRSPWEEQGTNFIEGIGTTWYLRLVNDGALWAAVAEEPHGWHMSISFRDKRDQLTRYPTWDEIAHTRDALLPADIGFVMHLPKTGEYIALHMTTFHLHEHPERGHYDQDQVNDQISDLRAQLEKMTLAYIEATNPGIDMEKVRRDRG
jgi:hypothetical protein